MTNRSSLQQHTDLSVESCWHDHHSDVLSHLLMQRPSTQVIRYVRSKLPSQYEQTLATVFKETKSSSVGPTKTLARSNSEFAGIDKAKTVQHQLQASLSMSSTETQTSLDFMSCRRRFAAEKRAIFLQRDPSPETQEVSIIGASV
jgi:hypothetical protein